MGDFFHQLHHRYFECNYGTVEMPWDRWFGSFHDGSQQGSEKTRERKKKMYSQLKTLNQNKSNLDDSVFNSIRAKYVKNKLVDLKTIIEELKK